MPYAAVADCNRSLSARDSAWLVGVRERCAHKTCMVVGKSASNRKDMKVGTVTSDVYVSRMKQRG